MVAACMIVVFLVAFFLGKPEAMLVIFVINCFVPDELPFVDEVVEVALIFSSFMKKGKAKDTGREMNSMTNFDSTQK